MTDSTPSRISGAGPSDPPGEGGPDDVPAGGGRAGRASPLDRHLVGLMESIPFGRLAVVHDQEPVVVVINHVVDGADLVFHTRRDTVLGALTAPGGDAQGAPGGDVVRAVFEVDSGSSARRAGWSVIAKGRLSQVVDPQERRRLLTGSSSWALPHPERFVDQGADQPPGRPAGEGPDDDEDVVLRLEIDALTSRSVGDA